MSGMTAKLNNDGAFHSREWWCVWREDMGGGGDSWIGWMGLGGVGWKGALQGWWTGTGGGEVGVPLADDHWTGGSRVHSVLKPDGESEGCRNLTDEFRRG